MRPGAHSHVRSRVDRAVHQARHIVCRHRIVGIGRFIGPVEDQRLEVAGRHGVARAVRLMRMDSEEAQRARRLVGAQRSLHALQVFRLHLPAATGRLGAAEDLVAQPHVATVRSCGPCQWPGDGAQRVELFARRHADLLHLDGTDARPGS